MPELTIADLINAKKDLDHIADLANSNEPTAIDRLGNVKQTATGAVESIKVLNPRGPWAPSTAYAIKDLVSVGGDWYVCVVDHTSSGTFETDSVMWRVYQGATLSGQETFQNKSFRGPVAFFTNGSRIGITGGAGPIVPTALVHIANENASTCGLRVASTWQGSTEAQYQNNDNSLWETFNKVTSNSSNFSWSISAPNAYNDIPAGVRDGGERVGVYGWATTVNIPDQFVHAGTLASQIGVRGRAGFQGPNTPSTAVIERSIAVKGEIYGESAGATIQNAYAGHFTSVNPASTVLNSFAVYAAASGGSQANYAFYGAAGKFYNSGQGIFGPSVGAVQSEALISVRGRNGVEFGHPSPNGYGSNLGATAPHGYPFLAFCAEADLGANTFRTRGQKGVLIHTDLTGRLIFSRLSNGNAEGQVPIEMGSFSADGNLTLAQAPRLPSRTPASATAEGKPGEVAWDGNYVYVCVATNTWKRSALSTW